MKKEIKINNYDDFKCIADKCRYTCCGGWDISVDDNTLNKWRVSGINNKDLSKSVKEIMVEDKKSYIIDKKTGEKCPFLDCNGLCEIVKNNGDDNLSLACKTFPRIINEFYKKKELTLSCSCPEVVEIISKMDNNIAFDGNDLDNQYNLQLNVRDTLVNVINNYEIPLETKLIINQHLLLSLLDIDELTKDILDDELDNYTREKYIKILKESYEQIELNRKNSLEELNGLFLDITQNYKNLLNIDFLLKDIYDYAENINIEDLDNNWSAYKDQFDKYNTFIQNCIVTKILSSCIDEDIFDMTIAYQLIVLEYVLVRYSIFLKWSMEGNKKVDIEDVKDYIVAFSRIIGNNSEAVIKFIEEGFGGEVLEEGYLAYITLF